MSEDTSQEIIMTGPDHLQWVDLETAAEICGLHPDMILEFVRAHIVSCRPHREDYYFDEASIYRLRQIHALRFEAGVNLRTVRLIIALIDRLESTELEVRRLREKMR